MAEAMRKILDHRAVAEALQVLRDLAKSSFSGVSPKHQRAFTTIDTLLRGLETREVELRIPIRQYQSKHDIDPNRDNTCNFIFTKKRGVCSDRPLRGTHRCYKHRVGGPANLATRRLAEGRVLPVISEEEASASVSSMQEEQQQLVVTDTAISDETHAGKKYKFLYQNGTPELLQVEARTLAKHVTAADTTPGFQVKVPRSIDI